MDDAALDEQRTARERRLRRRAGAGAALAALLGLIVVLTTSAGDNAPAQPRPVTGAASVTTATLVAPPSTVAARRRSVALPGAHRAPHEAVPILMYHMIGIRPAGAPNPTLWVPPQDFAAHVRALRRAGYHGVTLQQVWDAWHHDGTLPRKPVVFSFDDGHRGHVRDALPTLARAGWPGVLNLKLANLRAMGGTRAVRRMVRAGWEIDSHTITHTDLTTVGAGQLHDEVAGSRARLRRYLRVPVNFFAYPGGHYDEAVIAALRKAGYRAATTTQLGWARPGDNPFALPRVRVDGGMNAQAVLQRLRDTRPARVAP